MAALALLYKKREPLWALANDIIQNAFHGRGHHFRDMEMPRIGHFKPGDPLEARRFCQEYDDKKKDSHYAMAVEFLAIKTDSEKYLFDRKRWFGMRDDVHRKNRYRDVVPYDHNRVRLEPQQGSQTSTYINASSIKNLRGQVRFIATQGPTKETYEDFLRMLVEKHVKLVVTIIAYANIEEEMQKRQCFQYWPESVGSSKNLGRYVVHLEAESQRESLVNRTLKITGPNGLAHRFSQLHYVNWKDHETPDSLDDVISFLSVFRKAREGIPVVHCSAGVGRTGTFIALDFLMDALKDGCQADVPHMVKHLRSQRMLMVQTEEQYVFLYECINALLRQTMTAHHVNDSNNHNNRTSATSNNHRNSSNGFSTQIV